MKFETEYNITETVYLKTDEDQLERIITRISILPNNLVLYELSCSDESSMHYDFEISRTKRVF